MPAKHWLGINPVGKMFVFTDDTMFIYAVVSECETGNTDYIVCTCYSEKQPSGTECKVHLSRPLYPLNKTTFNKCKRLGWPSAPRIVMALVNYVEGGKA